MKDSIWDSLHGGSLDNHRSGEDQQRNEGWHVENHRARQHDEREVYGSKEQRMAE